MVQRPMSALELWARFLERADELFHGWRLLRDYERELHRLQASCGSKPFDLGAEELYERFFGPSAVVRKAPFFATATQVRGSERPKRPQRPHRSKRARPSDEERKSGRSQPVKPEVKAELTDKKQLKDAENLPLDSTDLESMRGPCGPFNI